LLYYFFFHTIFYDPIYNLLVFLVDALPGSSLGLAIIALTLIVKIILLPLAHKSTRTQIGMKKIEPQIKEIQKKYEKDKQEQAKKVMELYKEHKINPFSTFGLLIIQLPILIALYWVFRNGIPFTDQYLYSFVSLPETSNVVFLNLFDLTQRSIVIAVLVGFSQYVQIRLAMPAPAKTEGERTFKDDLARSMNLNMRYFMPAFIAFIAATLPSAISVYWITSNIFAIGHELLVKRRMARE
jgi:YidC/Oxa1 family membrane protein insertase